MRRPERRAWFRLAWQFGLPVREIQSRIDSREFTEWVAFLMLEPDAGTRADWLATLIAHHISRVEAAMGGRPIQVRGKLIEWGRTEADEEHDAEAALVAAINGNATTRH